MTVTTSSGHQGLCHPRAHFMKSRARGGQLSAAAMGAHLTFCGGVLRSWPVRVLLCQQLAAERHGDVGTTPTRLRDMNRRSAGSPCLQVAGWPACIKHGARVWLLVAAGCSGTDGPS